MTTCTYCGSTQWITRANVVICQQCELTPAQAAAEDQKHRGALSVAEAREAENRRRSEKVVEATEGMPMQERIRAAGSLLVDGLRLPREQWEPLFAAWKRDAMARMRASERRAG